MRHWPTYDKIGYPLSDGGWLPLEDDPVDAALANMDLHHTSDPQIAIREMARILKPGGRLVITDMLRHENDWMKTELADVWLGFEPSEICAWFKTVGAEQTHTA